MLVCRLSPSEENNRKVVECLPEGDSPLGQCAGGVHAGGECLNMSLTQCVNRKDAQRKSTAGTGGCPQRALHCVG